MKEQTRTFKELLEIYIIIEGLYRKDEKLKDTKFGYAFKRFYKNNIDPTLKERDEKLSDIRIKNALENKDTSAIITDSTNPRGYAYSKEGLLKCIKEETELVEKYNKMEIKVEPYISSFVPELSEEQRDILKGLLI